MPDKLFDLTSESGFPLGKSVQANLNQLLNLCPDYFSEAETDQLRHAASRAVANHSELVATRAGSHPLASKLNQSPIYVGLSALGNNSPELAPIRLMLVTAHLRSLNIPKSHLISAANLLGRLTYGSFSEARAIIDGLSSEPTQWAAKFDFVGLAKSKRTPEVRVVWDWLKTLRAQHPLANTSNTERPVRIPDDLVYRGKAIAAHESEQDPDTDAAETFPIINPDSPPKKVFNPEADIGALTLAKSDSFLRLNKKYSGDSLESLPPGLCRGLIEQLQLEFLKTDDISTKSAHLLWLLAFATGRSIDSFIRVLTGKPSKNETLLDVNTPEEGAITIRLLHPLSVEVPDIGDLKDLVSGDAAKEASFTIRFSRLQGFAACIDYISGTDSVEQKLLQSKKAVREKLRETVDWATETTIRGSVIQQVIVAHQDDPFAQLVFDELLNMSRASLHYLSYPSKDIAQIWTEAIRALAGNDSIVVESVDRSSFGAPRSLVVHDVFMRQVQSINLRLAKKMEPEERHSAMLAVTSACFALGTGHRPNKHLLAIARDDFCLSAGLAIIHDKPTATDRIRRLVVLPKLTIEWAITYIAHLEKLLKSPSISQELRQNATEALNGTGPLFFSLTDHSNALEFQSGVLGPGLYRHSVSQFLRDKGASALLREMHMGHQPVQPLFGPNGYVSPTDAARELQPYLDDWMALIGFPKPPSKALPKQTHRVADKHHLEALGRAASKRQKQAVMTLLKANIKAGTAHANDNYLHGLLDEFTHGAYSAGKEKVSISEAEVRVIVRRLAGHYEGKLGAIQASIRSCRKKLRRLRQEKQWDVFYPEPATYLAPSPIDLTAANLQAAETITEIERRLTNTPYPANALRLHTQLALILWAGCPSFEEAESWLEALRDARLEKYSTTLTVDLLPKEEDRAPESISISGRALIFVSAYLSANRLSKNASTSVLSDLELTKSDIQTAARLSRAIFFPGHLARAINSRGHTTELDHLKLAVLEGRASRDSSSLDEPPVLMHTPTRAAKAPPSEGRKCLRQLQSCVSDASSNKAASDAVSQLLDASELPFIEYWLAMWALDLLSGTANARTGGELRRQTVAGYLHDVFVPLRAINFDESFVDAEPDEIADLLDAALSEEPAQRQEQAQRLTRFFSSVGPSMGVSKLTLTYEGVIGVVDANIISNDEHEKSLMALTSWLENPELQAQYVGDVKAAIEILPLYQELGARRREISELRTKDWVTSDGVSFIFIRHTDWRSLKTKGSKRLLPVSTSQRGSSKYVFESLTKESGRSKGLDVATTALRVAGDANARIHHFRHARATREYLALAQVEGVFERVRRLASLSAALGHASIATTLHYYVHIVRYALAQSEQGNENLFSSNALCAVLSLKPDYLRQKRRRARKNGHPLSVELTRKLQDNKRTEEHKLDGDLRCLPLPIGLGRPTKEGRLKLAHVASWHQLYFSGESATQATIKSALDLLRLGEIMTSGISLADQLGWDVYPHERATSDVEQLEKEGVYAEFQRKVTRKKVQQDHFTADIAALRSDASHAGHLTSLHMSQVNWKTRAPLEITVSPESAKQINTELKTFSLPVRLETSGPSGSHWRVRSINRKARGSKHENYYVRFFLFVVLVYNDLVNRQPQSLPHVM